MRSFVEYSKVPDKYRLSFIVGKIVRNDVRAENETKVLFNRLRAGGLPSDPMLRDFGKVIPQVRRMLMPPQVPEEFQKIAIQVIELTSRERAVRRETVHDILIQMPFESEQILSGFGNGKSRALADLEKCADDLKEAMWRVRAVASIAPQWITGALAGWETVERLRSWTRVAMGEIADNENAMMGTPGKSPEPPGGFRISAEAH